MLLQVLKSIFVFRQTSRERRGCNLFVSSINDFCCLSLLSVVWSCFTIICPVLTPSHISRLHISCITYLIPMFWSKMIKDNVKGTTWMLPCNCGIIESFNPFQPNGNHCDFQFRVIFFLISSNCTFSSPSCPVRWTLGDMCVGFATTHESRRRKKMQRWFKKDFVIHLNDHPTTTGCPHPLSSISYEYAHIHPYDFFSNIKAGGVTLLLLLLVCGLRGHPVELFQALCGFLYICDLTFIVSKLLRTSFYTWIVWISHEDSVERSMYQDCSVILGVPIWQHWAVINWAL